MDENMEELDNIITLNNENGEEVNFEFLDLVELDNEQYGYIKNTYVAPNSLRFVREDGITKIYSGDQRVGEDLDKIYLGEFRITSYCNCVICCEQWAGFGTTASGTHVTEGRTIAVDPNVIPLGSKVEFNNNNNNT